MSTVIAINHARRHLGELVQEAHYKGKPFVLTRNKKPMAALIGSQAFNRFIEWLEEHDRGLADTLAIMSNSEIQEILEESGRDIAAGRTIPIKDILND